MQAAAASQAAAPGQLHSERTPASYNGLWYIQPLCIGQLTPRTVSVQVPDDLYTCSIERATTCGPDGPRRTGRTDGDGWPGPEGARVGTRRCDRHFTPRR